MKPYSNEYHANSLDRDHMKTITRALVKGLRRELSGAMPIFCFAGLSGTTHAAALMLAWRGPMGMMYVRKKHERRHSSNAVEWQIDRPRNKKPPVLVFVDDFTCSGNTKERVLDLSTRVLKREGLVYDRENHVEALGGSSGTPNPKVKWVAVAP